LTRRIEVAVSIWVVEQIVGAIPSLEPIELLTYAAVVTPKL
jgi:hypothetical protein